jgi:hypothetical protein
MDALIARNPGVKSRFPNVMHFADYTGAELLSIARDMLTAKVTAHRGMSTAVPPRECCRTPSCVLPYPVIARDMLTATVTPRRAAGMSCCGVARGRGGMLRAAVCCRGSSWTRTRRCG